MMSALPVEKVWIERSAGALALLVVPLYSSFKEELKSQTATTRATPTSHPAIYRTARDIDHPLRVATIRSGIE